MLRIKYVLLMACLFWGSALAQTKEYQLIEWIQLMPEDDLQALLNPPEYLADVVDGSPEDSVEAFSDSEIVDEQSQRFQQALTSTRVIQAFKDQHVKIPGFIVPLNSDEQQRAIEFFIVPYFGACLHMPPPPPNQIIYATLDEGVTVPSLYNPFWFEGTMAIETVENDLGKSAYRLILDRVYPYEEE